MSIVEKERRRNLRSLNISLLMSKATFPVPSHEMNVVLFIIPRKKLSQHIKRMRYRCEICMKIFTTAKQMESHQYVDISIEFLLSPTHASQQIMLIMSLHRPYINLPYCFHIFGHEHIRWSERRHIRNNSAWTIGGRNIG